MFPKISSKVSGYIAMTSSWARWRPKSTASRLFAQSFVQVQIKENIKAPRHWPLRGESTGDRWIPSQKASNAKNVSIWWRHLEIPQGAVYKIEHTLIQPGLPCPLNEWLPFGSFESINGWFDDTEVVSSALNVEPYWLIYTVGLADKAIDLNRISFLWVGNTKANSPHNAAI